MIEARELTKRYGDTTAAHSLSFTIAPGTVTGFLDRNSAGKSTTMRMITGPGHADVGHRQRQALPAAPCPATRGRRPGRGKRRAAYALALALALIMAAAVTLHRHDA